MVFSRIKEIRLLALASLILPWVVSYGNGWVVYSWNIFWYYNSESYNSFEFIFSNPYFLTLYYIFYLISFLFLIIGVILLFKKPNYLRLCSSFFFLSISTYIFGEFIIPFIYGYPYYFTFIPMGLLLAFITGVLGFAPNLAFSKPVSSIQTNKADRLLKLKELLDSGAITKEEFEEQKRRILEEIKSF